MSLGHGASIVRDGLLLHLDAANSKSYSGTGSAWKDLKNNSNNTLFNSPIYESGALQFDGTNDYVQLPTTFFSHNSGSPFSVSVWFKTATNGGIIFGQTGQENFLTTSSYVPAIYVNTLGRVVTSCFWGGATSNTATSTISVTDNKWYNIVVTFSSNTQRSYLNGNLYSTITKTQTAYGTGPYYYFLGVGRQFNWPNTSTNPYFSGSISSFMFYTKQLSNSEIVKNYEALRGRYNI